MSLSDFFNSFDDCCAPVGSSPASFEWCAKGVGFGGMYFYFDEKDGYVHCENEIMGREFLKKMLCLMVDNCVLDCPGQWDEATEGKPPGYTPRPVVKSEAIADNEGTDLSEN